jgi:preprotein translocase subunit Sec61beta
VGSTEQPQGLTPAQQAWVDDYEREEKRMSRSNPTEASRNPCTRWFQFASGADGGFVRYYDKEAEKNIELGDADKGGKFVFLLLDELATVSGWHDPSESAIFANEVRDTRQDTLVVKSFKGGELASGLYASIKDRIVAVGGHFVSSCYIAYKDGDGLRLGNIRFKGAALGTWMEFKKQCPTKKDASGKSVKAYYVDAVKIDGFEQMKKGGTTFRVPKFGLVSLSEETNKQALALDAELQAYLADYLKRPRVEAAAATSRTEEAQVGNGRFADMKDDLPWTDDEISRAKAAAEEKEEVPF